MMRRDGPLPWEKKTTGINSSLSYRLQWGAVWIEFIGLLWRGWWNYRRVSFLAEKIPASQEGFDPRTVQLVASHNSECIILAHNTIRYRGEIHTGTITSIIYAGIYSPTQLITVSQLVFITFKQHVSVYVQLPFSGFCMRRWGETRKQETAKYPRRRGQGLIQARRMDIRR
jgi:hypothetical protein